MTASGTITELGNLRASLVEAASRMIRPVTMPAAGQARRSDWVGTLSTSTPDDSGARHGTYRHVVPELAQDAADRMAAALWDSPAPPWQPRWHH